MELWFNRITTVIQPLLKNCILTLQLVKKMLKGQCLKKANSA